MANSKLIVGLYELYKCPFYWGEMKRNDAKALFDKKSDGTFLVFYNSESLKFEILIKFEGNLAEGFLEPEFLVGGIRSLEASHRFGCGHRPLIRNRAFSLKELSRAQIRKTNITFEAISVLECPESLKKFLQEYHVAAKPSFLVKLRLLRAAKSK